MKDIIERNKGLTFENDLLGHPIKVSGSKNDIEYVYAADGRKLHTVHTTYTSTSKKTVKTSTTKDYANGYIFTNGKPSMFAFDGGYYSFDTNGKLNGCHYYIQDYQGNNRMVVNATTNRTEQVTHYYPYGELMADISTSPDAQQFKYGGKELDRSFGLDLYDFHARQQDAKLGRFNSIDPLAEKYYRLSPYSYCGGDPVNCVDPDGRDIYKLTSKGYIFNVQKSASSHLIAQRDGHQVFFGNVDKALMDQLSVKSHEMSKNNPVKEGQEPTEANIHPDARKNSHTGITEAENAFELFRFLGENSSGEWKLSLSKDGKYTFHCNQSDKSVDSKNSDNENSTNTIHTHHEDETPEAGVRDMENATNSQCNYYIYYPNKGIVIQYDHNKSNKCTININQFGF